MDTQRFIQGLCSELQHPEAVSACVKKLVIENWLDKADNLRYVPRSRLEGWGVPLKLISEVYEYLTDAEAIQAINSASAFVRYNVRPFTDSLHPRGLLRSWKDDAMKRQKPDEWAARRLQAWFRRRQKQKLQDLAIGHDVVHDWLDSNDFSLRSEEDVERRRLEGADSTFKKHLGGFIRVWRERKRQESMAGGFGQVTVIGVQDLKQGVSNPHCTLSVTDKPESKTTVTIGRDALAAEGDNRRSCIHVQVGNVVEVEVWEKDRAGKKSEVFGKASLTVGREMFLPGGCPKDLSLSLPSTRAALRKAKLQVLIESAQARKAALITDLPGEPLRGIGAALARLHKGKPKNCPVTDLMFKLGRELYRQDSEMTPLIHRLVTLNWLEDVEDLELVEDRHWELWGFPEKLVVLLKAELLERQEESVFKGWDNFRSNITSMFAWM